MADDMPKDDSDELPPPETEAGDDYDPNRGDRGGLSDFVRRALSAGFGAASGSKDALVRVLAGEVRNWLDHLDLDSEIVRALGKMTIEVKAEFRFRPDEDGKLAPETVSAETKIKKV